MKTTTLVLLISLFIIGCTCPNSNTPKGEDVSNLKAENDSLKLLINEKKQLMKQQIITSLTFRKNDAEQAMKFYIDLFDNSKIISLHRWGKEESGKEGTIKQATFELNGKLFMCSDSPPVHNWDFTPAVSNYVECESEKEVERLFSKLSENGEVAMPVDNYGFSQKFAWVIDQFGVSWQLNLQ